MPDESGRGGLSLRDPSVDESSVVRLDQLPRGQGNPVLPYVEDTPKASDDNPLAIRISSRNGLVDERTSLDAKVRNGVEQGAFVEVIDDNNLHIAGNLPDKHTISPFFDDEGEVILAFLSGCIPAELAGRGINGEGGRSSSFAGGTKSGGVLINRNRSPVATC